MTKEVKTLLIIGGIIAAIAAVLIVVSRYTASSKPIATEAIVREDTHFKGIEGASVTLVEFGDFQCPACAASEPMLDQLLTDFPEDLRFAYRHFPLISIHPNATRAAEAAEAAAEQGKFWEMHDILFSQQNVWSGLANPSEQFKAYAQQLELDMDQFNRDSTDPEVTGRVNRDFDDGGRLGVSGTPTFFLNGQRVEDSSYEGLKAAIQEIVDAQGDDANDQATPSAMPTDS